MGILDEHYTLELSYQDRSDIGFRYDPRYDSFAYAFPVYLYKTTPVVMCRLSINENDEVDLHVVSNGVTYAPYYNREGLKSKVNKIIDKNIRRELKKLGAKRV